MSKKFTIPLYMYFLSHFFYGQYFNVLGALIPYLTQQTSRLQQQWAYIFTLRGIGYLIGGFIQRLQYFNNKNYHRRIFLSCLTTGLSFILFSLTLDIYLLGIIVFIGSIAACSLQIMINVLLLMEGREDPKFYLNFSYVFYGLGAITGPIIIAWLGLKGPFMIGFCQVLVSFGFLLIASSQQKKQKQKQNSELQQLNSYEQFSFAFLVMFYAGITLSIRNWLPTFIVIQDIAEKQFGAYTISIYSTTITVFRFLFLIVTIQTGKFLQICASSIIIVLIISISCYTVGLYMLMIYISTVSLGILFSSYYPSLWAIPKTYGKIISSKNSATMMIFYAIGQGILIAIIGYFIVWIHPIMLFLSCLLMIIISKLILSSVIQSLRSNFYQLKQDLIQLQITKK